jgi:hypothetical protein
VAEPTPIEVLHAAAVAEFGRRLRSARHAATMAQLGFPHALVPDFAPLVVTACLSVATVRLGDAGEAILKAKADEVVLNLAEIAVWSLIDLMSYLDSIAPPASAG